MLKRIEVRPQDFLKNILSELRTETADASYLDEISIPQLLDFTYRVGEDRDSDFSEGNALVPGEVAATASAASIR